MRFTVVCSMRNEGPFLAEWVAWYRALGFTDIIVVTNDCTDHSPQMLDLMAAHGLVTHLRHEVPDRQQITARKLAAAKTLPQVAEADWVLVCDVDEFLVVHRGAGRITDLVADDADFLGMSINWKVFGTSGHLTYEDGLVHRQFTRCATTDDPSSTWVKSIHARPCWFRRLGEHGPKGLLPRHARLWGGPGMRWVDATGRNLHDWHPESDYLRRVQPGRQDHSAAQMNHYIIRSDESFALKKGTLSPVAGKDRYTDAFYNRYNRNEAEDRSALARGHAFEAEHAAIMAIPGLRKLHHRCCADYVARLVQAKGGKPETDPRWRRHVEMAGPKPEPSVPRDPE